MGGARVMRRLFFSLAVISLALCMSMLILPLFSRTGQDHWHLTFESGRPVTQINWDLTLCTSMRFAYTSSVGINWRYRQLIVPYDAVAVCFAIVPAVWVWRFSRRAKSIRAGFCAICGYDLRATPERCPECGAIPKHLGA